MKKKFIILCTSVVIVMMVCLLNNGEKKDILVKEKEVKKVSHKLDSKELYSSVVPSLPHDDLYNNFKEKEESVDNDNKIINVSLNDEEVLEESDERKNEDIKETLEQTSQEIIEVEDDNMNKKVIDENSDDINYKEKISSDESNNYEVIKIDEKKEDCNTNIPENIDNSLDDNNEKITEITIESEASNNAIVASNDVIVKEKEPYIKKDEYGRTKVVDVSFYQGDINWDVFLNESDCYGVILRLGFYDTLDKKFERNINELKRLNIPYGIYLFSYSTTLTGSSKEADFTNRMLDRFNIEPTLGIYYDIESWTAGNGANSNGITKEDYDNIITNYVDKVSNHVNYKYKVKVYSGRWYAMNRLGTKSKAYVDWVAEYGSNCKYDGSYSMWQYTSKGSVPGINGNVDISYIL